MRVWKICRKLHARDTLKGRGGLYTSGRWHTKGRPVVYTSQSLALAALEILVHVDRAIVPGDLVQIEIEWPDDLEIMTTDVADLPKHWQSYPALPELQRHGEDWLSGEVTPVLQVPSSVIPEECNYLLNPQHPDACKAAIVSLRNFTYDPRLTP